MSLSLSDLATYLTTTGEFEDVQLNRLQDKPDEAIAVTAVGGTAPILDGAFESTTLHVRIRSTTDAAAETLALALHAFLSAHEGSFTMGDTYVLSMSPASGPPQYFDRDVDNRTTYMGSYDITVAV